jgi:hypothetical protein
MDSMLTKADSTVKPIFEMVRYRVMVSSSDRSDFQGMTSGVLIGGRQLTFA